MEYPYQFHGQVALLQFVDENPNVRIIALEIGLNDIRRPQCRSASVTRQAVHSMMEAASLLGNRRAEPKNLHHGRHVRLEFASVFRGQHGLGEP